MSKFARFMKENKAVKENTKYAATKSLTDEKGVPLEWVIKPLTTKENEEIRNECMKEVQTKNGTKSKFDSSKYIARILCECIVVPDLFDTELQNSYGVQTPEDLVMAMVDDPGEYNRFAQFVSEFNGFVSLDEKVEEAKN